MGTRKGPARSRQREEFWRRIVTRQAKSELSIRQWCRQQGVAEPSFYAWRRTLARRRSEQDATTERPRARLLAVDVASAVYVAGRVTEPTAGAGLQLVVQDVRIEIAAGFDGDTLRRLLRVLREAAAC